jgi:hypothetical protein
MIHLHSIFPKQLILLLALAHGVSANEALDVLEGKKKASDIQLPPAEVVPGEEGSDETVAREDLIYLEPGWTPSAADAVWARAILFEDVTNPWVQQIAIAGIFDWQASYGQAEVEAVKATPSKNIDLDNTRTRRARLGARLRAFRNTDLEASVELAGDNDYNGIEKLSGLTEVAPGTSIQYGKFRPTFSTESGDDAYNPYPDRSMLTNMLAPGPSLGVMFNQLGKTWDYGVGWFSSDSNPNIPSLQSDGFLAFNLSRTFVEPSGKSVMRTRWHLDYIHNLDGGSSDSIPRYNVAGKRSANGNQLITRNPAFRHLVSTGITIDQGDFSFTGDFKLGKGDTTAWGLTLAPTYWLLPGTLQLVGRYQYAGSDEAGSLVSSLGTSSDLAFDDSPFFIGDEFHSFYLGANLHLYQDQLTLMSGFEQIIIKDDQGQEFNTDAAIWHTGARVSF